MDFRVFPTVKSTLKGHRFDSFEELACGIRRVVSGPYRNCLGFEMDAVSSVTADNLPTHLAVIEYYSDPILENFTAVKVYRELQKYLTIKGKGLKMAANEDDVIVKIECENCNVTSVSNEKIICELPRKNPACDQINKHKLIVTVSIGCFQKHVGYLTYETLRNAVTVTVNIWVFIIIAALIASLLTGVGVYGRYRWKRQKKRYEEMLRKMKNTQANENRNSSAAPNVERRRSTGTYAVIDDNDVINVYLELSGETDEYTKPDEYMEPHPYCKLDHPTDKPNIKTDDETNANLAVDENQTGVDELQKDPDVDYIHPIV